MKTKDIISDKLSKIEEAIRDFEEETGSIPMIITVVTEI